MEYLLFNHSQTRVFDLYLRVHLEQPVLLEPEVVMEKRYCMRQENRFPSIYLKNSRISLHVYLPIPVC